MNVVKGLGTMVLCILLFITVGLLAMGTWLKATVFNQSFVNREVQSIDITGLARNVLDEEVSFDLPEEYAVAEPVVKDMAIQVIAIYEPWLKEQFDRITTQFYDYLHRRTDELAINIDLTGVKSTLKDNLWAIYTENAATYLPEIVSGVEDYIVEHPADIVEYIPGDFLPAEARLLAEDQLVAYLEANPDLVRAQIDSLDTNTILGSLTDEVVQPFFDEFIDSAISDIPDVYDVDTELLGQEGLDALSDSRRYLGYFETGYYALIGLAVVLMALVWVIWREIKRPALATGITLAFFGFLELAGTIIGRTVNPFDYAQGQGLDIPVYAQDTIINIYHDALQPMLTFDIIVLVVGVGLIVLSFFGKSRRREPEPIED
jgi:hypothetical protein